MKANIIISIIFMAGALIVSNIQIKRRAVNIKKAGQMLIKWNASPLAIFPFKLIAFLIILLYLGWLYVSYRGISEGFYYALSSLSIIIFIWSLFFWQPFCALGSSGAVLRGNFYPLSRISIAGIEEKYFWGVLKISIFSEDKSITNSISLMMPKKIVPDVRKYFGLSENQT